MSYMHRRRSRVKSNPAQLDFFHLLDGPPTTVAETNDFAFNAPLVNRLKAQTGWDDARCIAHIEANGGCVYV